MLKALHIYIASLILLAAHKRGARCSLFAEIEKTVHSRYSFRQCIETVAEIFFHSNKEIVVVIADKDKYLPDFPKHFSKFEHKTYWSLYTSNVIYLEKIPHCYDNNYILEIKDLKDLMRTFQIMRQSNCWNPNQHIFVYSSFLLPHDEFNKMVKLVTEQYLANVVIMLPLEKKLLNFHIYYWESRTHENCAVKVKLPEYFTCSLGNISTPITYEKTESWASCVLRIKAVIWPPFVIGSQDISKLPEDKSIDRHAVSGFEIELINLISQTLGIEIDYHGSVKEDWGRSFFNGTTTKTMQDLTMKKVDIAIGSFTTSLSRTVLFSTSFPYSEEYVVCCVPSNSYVDVWSTLMSASTLQLYISISITYLFLTTMIWQISRIFEEKHKRYKEASTCYLYCFAILVGSSVKILPESRNGRLFLILLVLFEFFYVAFYESLLTSILLSPKLNEDIQTFADIVDRDMEIYNQPENRRYFEHTTTEFGRKAMSLWIDCPNTTDCLEDVHKNRKKAICLGKTFKDYVTFDKLWAGKPSFSCIRHNLMTYPVVMIMRRTLPFRKQIDQIINNCLSAGLIDKWLSSSFYNRSSRSYTGGTNLFSSLKFTNLKPVFVVLITGYLIASALAAGEMIYHSFDPVIRMFIYQLRLKIRNFD